MGTGVGQVGASAHHGNMDAPAHQSPGNIKISELQKIALLGTSRILRETLSIK